MSNLIVIASLVSESEIWLERQTDRHTKIHTHTLGSSMLKCAKSLMTLQTKRAKSERGLNQDHF